MDPFGRPCIMVHPKADVRAHRDQQVSRMTVRQPARDPCLTPAMLIQLPVF